MNGDDKAYIAAFSFWAVVILLMIITAYQGVKFVCVKTSSAISSYTERADVREAEVKAEAAAEENKKLAWARQKKARKKRLHLHKLQQSPGWHPEFGDLMYNADGSLKDPNPHDSLSPEQHYGVLALFLLGVFVVWAGCWSRIPILYVTAVIFTFCLALYLLFV